jgi:hypothetical protein
LPLETAAIGRTDWDRWVESIPIQRIHRAFDVSFSAQLWQGPFTIGEFPL